MTAAPGFVMALPGQCKEVLEALGGRLAIQASAETTQGAYSLVEMSIPSVPGGVAPPPAHLHRTDEEAFFILEGSLTFHISGKVADAPAGSFVLVPRGTVHTFAIPEVGARWLTIFSPSGMEGYFREMAKLGETYRTLSRQAIQEAARRYNFEFV